MFDVNVDDENREEQPRKLFFLASTDKIRREKSYLLAKREKEVERERGREEKRKVRKEGM